MEISSHVQSSCKGLDAATVMASRAVKTLQRRVSVNLLDVNKEVCARGVVVQGARCIDDPYAKMDREMFWYVCMHGQLSGSSLEALTRNFHNMRARSGEELLTPILCDLHALVQHLPDHFIEAWQDEEMIQLKATPNTTNLPKGYLGKHIGYLTDIYEYWKFKLREA